MCNRSVGGFKQKQIQQQFHISPKLFCMWLHSLTKGLSFTRFSNTAILSLITIWLDLSKHVQCLRNRVSKADDIKIKRNVSVFFPPLSHLPFFDLLSRFFVLSMIPLSDFKAFKGRELNVLMDDLVESTNGGFHKSSHICVNFT